MEWSVEWTVLSKISRSKLTQITIIVVIKLTIPRKLAEISQFNGMTVLFIWKVISFMIHTKQTRNSYNPRKRSAARQWLKLKESFIIRLKIWWSKWNGIQSSIRSKKIFFNKICLDVRWQTRIWLKTRIMVNRFCLMIWEETDLKTLVSLKEVLIYSFHCSRAN